MSRVRLVISDVDGTLVRSDKSLSMGVVEAVARLRRAGVGFSLISARPPFGMKWLIERLGIDTPVGAFNGGTIMGPGGAILSADRVPPEAAARALALLDRPAVTPWLYADGLWYAQTLDNHHVPREILAANAEPVVVDRLDGLLAHVDKIVGVSEDHDLLARIEPEVAAALGTAATVARSQLYYLDVTGPRANKGDGVAALAAALNVPLAETAVFGDQRNDLPMIARAGMSVVMGQAPEAVKAAATHVARSNDEDGVADAIDRFVLPHVMDGAGG